MPDVPEALRARMLAVHGAAGERWLAQLPANVARLEREWGFALGPHFPGLSYSYVAEATLTDGTPAVLKAQPPHLESRSELAALRAWDGNGAVRLLIANAEAGFALLELVTPGDTAESIADDDEATGIIARVMTRLHIPPPADTALITLDRWGEALLQYVSPGDDPLPQDLVRDAAAAWRSLVESSPAPVLLHGDLHHGNVLSSHRGGWLAIDPKGVVGDPAFDPSALFFNPHARLAHEADIPTLVSRRLALVCEAAALDRARVAAWGFARAVLSLCWSRSSGSPLEPHIVAVAQALRDLSTHDT